MVVAMLAAVTVVESVAVSVAVERAPVVRAELVAMEVIWVAMWAVVKKVEVGVGVKEEVVKEEVWRAVRAAAKVAVEKILPGV